MNQLHAQPARMHHQKRQLGVPIIGGAPGAGAANPTSTREAVTPVPSSAPPAAPAPSTRVIPDPVTLRTSFSLFPASLPQKARDFVIAAGFDWPR